MVLKKPLYQHWKDQFQTGYKAKLGEEKGNTSKDGSAKSRKME